MTTTEIMAIVGGLLLGYRIVGKLIGRKQDNPSKFGNEDKATDTGEQSTHHAENPEPHLGKEDSDTDDQRKERRHS